MTEALTGTAPVPGSGVPIRNVKAIKHRFPYVWEHGRVERDDSGSDAHAALPMEARRAIEQVLWRHGHRGDSCAFIAQAVVDALTQSGFASSRSPMEFEMTQGEPGLGVLRSIRRAGAMRYSPRWLDDVAEELSVDRDAVAATIDDPLGAGYLVADSVDEPADALSGTRGLAVRLTLKGDRALDAQSDG